MATFSTCPVRGLILGFKNTDQVKNPPFKKHSGLDRRRLPAATGATTTSETCRRRRVRRGCFSLSLALVSTRPCVCAKGKLPWSLLVLLGRFSLGAAKRDRALGERSDRRPGSPAIPLRVCGPGSVSFLPHRIYSHVLCPVLESYTVEVTA